MTLKEAALFGSLSFYGAGSASLFPEEVQREPEMPTPDVAAQPAGLVPVTLDVQYQNGVRPRGLRLAHKHDGRKADGIFGRNPDRSGVFQVHLAPGSHHVRWLLDRLTMHQDDPLPLGTPEWTIDTANASTWELTVPVAAQVLVHDPARRLPELWQNGVRVTPTWEEWSGRHRGGPTHLSTCCWGSGSKSKIALVKPGTYTIYRGTGAQRWCRTIVLSASEPFVLDKN